MTKKLFISLPMNGLTDGEILKRRDDIYSLVKSAYRDDAIELIDSLIPDNPPDGLKNIPVWYLGKSIELLSQADIACFARKWADYRGCVAERDIASTYGIPICYETNLYLTA